MSYESQKRQEIMEAYLFLREKNQSIPSDTLELMKDAALESLVSKNESIGDVSECYNCKGYGYTKNKYGRSEGHCKVCNSDR